MLNSSLLGGAIWYPIS